MGKLCRACQPLCSTTESIELLCSPDGYKAHGTVAALKENAGEGCQFCGLMIDPRYASTIDYAFIVQERQHFNVRLKGTRSKNDTLEYILLQSNLGSSRDYWVEHMSFKIYINDNNSTEMSLKSIIGFDTSEAMHDMKEWLENCAEHQNCAFNARPKLPTRVLDLNVKDRDDVRLIESNGQRGKYALLSYCWGGEQATVTTKSNIAAHRDRLSISSLSQTIQDAITVAQNLNLDYLWVDALCIIQNDPEDKMLEIAKMHEYFKNGSLTIIAASASRAQDGFLRPPKTPSCDLPYMTSDTKVTTATLTYNIEDSESGYKRELNQHENLVSKFRSPIFNRAWTFEESILSRKKLRFGFNQIEWECQDSFAMFTQKIDGASVVMESLVGRGESDPPEFDYFAKNYNPSFATILTSWDKAVENYTSRHLTKPEDKLPAIGAIAHEFHRVRRGTYLAGIWKERLYIDLLWYMDRPSHILPTVRRLYEPEIAKAPFNRAPSWSWAAVDGKVKKGKIYGEFNEEAILRGFCVQPKSPRAPFGQVRPGGYLEFDACVKLVPALDPDKYFGNRFPLYNSMTLNEAVKFDLESEENWASCEAWYLWLATRNYKREWGESPLEAAAKDVYWRAETYAYMQRLADESVDSGSEEEEKEEGIGGENSEQRATAEVGDKVGHGDADGITGDSVPHYSEKTGDDLAIAALQNVKLGDEANQQATESQSMDWKEDAPEEVEQPNDDGADEVSEDEAYAVREGRDAEIAYQSSSESDTHVLDEAIGLIVASTGDKYSNDFRRIGVFFGAPPNWFARTPRSRVRLV